MFSKQVIAIACVSVLGAGAVGTSLAAEESASNTARQTDASDAQSTQSQPSSYSDGSSGQTGSNSTDAAMAQDGKAHSTGGKSGDEMMAGKQVRDRQGKSIGQLAGVVVGRRGQVEAFVVRTDKTQNNGEKSGNGSGTQNNYVLVPREAVQTQSRSQQSSSQGAGGQGASGSASAQGPHAGLTYQERTLVQMYQALKQQQSEISQMKQQIAQMQQSADRDQAARHGMNSGNGQTGNSNSDPLNQVKRVILDRYGQVTALVLDSGMVLTPDTGTGGTGSAQANPNNALSGQTSAGQDQQAIILFHGDEQAMGNTDADRDSNSAESNGAASGGGQTNDAESADSTSGSSG